MKVSGTATLSAPRERVFAALNDPAVLVRTIPGCEQLEEVGPDRYRMTITAGVASIKGTYVGDVALADQDAPSSFVLRASGSGAPGTVSADVTVTLDDADGGSTLLRYDADAVVGGPVGGVGQRVLSGVAKKTAGEFFGAVDDVLTGRAPERVASPTEEGVVVDAAQAAGGPAAAAGGPPAADGRPAAPAARPTVFRAPAPPVSADADPQAFFKGAALGAVIALTGALVGGVLARRRG